jgi:hypothetical protein
MSNSLAVPKSGRGGRRLADDQALLHHLRFDHATITHVTPTGKVTAGLSKGASVAAMVLLPAVPVPRIPIGLGGLSLEA